MDDYLDRFKEFFNSLKTHFATSHKSARKIADDPAKGFEDFEVALYKSIQKAFTLTDDVARERHRNVIEHRDYDAAKHFIIAALNDYKKFREEKRQLRWAELESKFYFLLFRVATAIGIAAVILLTGWLAMKWGIPLPMLRITP